MVSFASGIEPEVLIRSLTALITLLGIFIAIWQLHRTQKQARARVLTNLMKAWDESYLEDGKNIFYPSAERLLEPFARSDKRTAQIYHQHIASVREQSAREVDAFRQEDRLNKYVPLLRVADFFQNVALMVERGYIRKDDALDLFGHHLRLFDIVCGGYIREELQTLLGNPRRRGVAVRYQALADLAEEAHERYARAL